jgi:hypothetical protein
MTGEFSSLTTNQDSDEARLQLGARRILTESMQLRPGDTVVIFSDETTTEPARVLTRAAEALDLRVRNYPVTLEHQRAFNSSSGLCHQCRAAFQDATAILTCLSDGSETTGYRRELLTSRTGAVRLGHVPGANLTVISSAAEVDYRHAAQRCDDLALVLTVGQRARLETYVVDENGKTMSVHTLGLGLGGFDRLPVISTGIIPAGSWGNLPGGETFIAPVEGTADGEVAINGAISGRVLQEPEALVLTFTHSRLTDWRGPADVLARFERLLAPGRHASQADGRDWDALAELGIGVNEGIRSLTGNNLFDEKCDGTIHIAVGDSTGFGGHYRALLHEDLITRWPSLWIDEVQIMDHGRNAFEPQHWRERIDAFPADAHLARQTRIGRSAEQVLLEDGAVSLYHQVAAGRICRYRIGDDATSQKLAAIYRALPPFPQSTILDALCDQLADRPFAREQVYAGVSILMRHRTVSVY